MISTNVTHIVTRDNVDVIHINNAYARAQISLFGGHILSFKPKHDNRERLWCSEKAIFDGHKAIRGGVPLCWPWFGDHSDTGFTAHGYVRTQVWSLVESSEVDTGTKLVLQPNTSSGAGFAYEAQLQLVVVIGKTLEIALRTTNIGSRPLTYNCALHTYFNVSDISECELLGISGSYSDKTQGFKLFETPSPYKISAETDRVHLANPKSVTIKDSNTETEVLSIGHDSLVVWNPWRDKSIAMQDMADDSYKTMLCVETAITQNQRVDPQETHVLEQIIG